MCIYCGALYLMHFYNFLILQQIQVQTSTVWQVKLCINNSCDNSMLVLHDLIWCVMYLKSL